MIKAIIFDFDGTLVDTLEDLKDAINKSLLINGYTRQYTYEETKSLIGMGTKILCQRAISYIKHSDEDVEKVFNSFSITYRQIQCNKTHLFPYVQETLDELKSRKIKIAILSNKVEENTLKISNYLFKKGTFDQIVGQRKEFPLKPDPTSLKYLISLLNVSENEVLYVGDSETDMKTADNLKLKKVAVTYGYCDEDVLKKYQPNYLVDDFSKLIEIISYENECQIAYKLKE